MVASNDVSDARSAEDGFPDVVDVVEVLVDEVVVDGFTVDEVEVLEELDVLVELVDDVDPRLVPSSVG